jgi:CRP-like cAMP-binding protein
LTSHLERVELRCGDVLEFPGKSVDIVHFPIDALVSMFAIGTSERRRLEVASVGPDGMTAPTLLLGDLTAPCETLVQIRGCAWRMDAATLRQMVEEDVGIRCHMLSHIARLMRQVMDNTWHVGRATIQARVARWLLQATDRLNSGEMSITHESLSDVLGVRRSGVTLALHELEGKGLVRVGRVKVIVRDRAGLTAEASNRHVHSAAALLSAAQRSLTEPDQGPKR